MHHISFQDQNTCCTIQHNAHSQQWYKSHTNVSQAYLNLISTWINSNRNMLQANPITILMSQKYWKLIFVELPQYVCKSSCIFTTRILYFVRIHLVGENMEIHLVFTLQNNFKPLVSSKLAKVPYSKYLLGEDEKCVCNLQQPLKLTN